MSWILKTEPEVYSIDDLARENRTDWTGVANPQALKNLASMKVGDRVLIYHTGGVREVVGEARVTRAGEPVQIEFVRKFKNPVGLAAIKAKAAFKDIALVRQGRLSVSAVNPGQFATLLKMAE